MASNISSSVLLQKIYDKFASQFCRKGSLIVSKRDVSTILLESKDASLLSKWTNPGNRSKWHIPLERIPEVCEKLGASVLEMDELMFARLEELASIEPDRDVFSVMIWFEDLLNRLRPADEVQVVDAYRRVASRYPIGLQQTQKEVELLEKVFDRFLARSEALELEEQEAYRANDCDPEFQTKLRRKRESILNKAKAQRAADEKAELAKKRQDIRKTGKTIKRAVVELLKDYARRVKESG
jgi:hypothetical protein